MDEIEGLTLTPRLRRSLSEAARVARDRGHAFLGTEHVLLGLLAEPDGVAAQVLAQLGVVEQTRLQLEQIMDSPGYFAPPPPQGADLELRTELLRRRAPRRGRIDAARRVPKELRGPELIARPADRLLY